MKPLIHAQNSAKKYGGTWEDYIEIHNFLDSSKAVIADNRHRALTHNSWFISTVIPKVFGETFERKSDGKLISSRDIAEQHVLEDYKMKYIPAASDFLTLIPYQDWMQNGEKGYPQSYEGIVKKEDSTGVLEDFIGLQQRTFDGVQFQHPTNPTID